MKKPFSKYMDDKTINILEKSIKAGEVQRTIEMIDTLILFYCENGLDIDEEDENEDEDEESDISYNNEQETNNENMNQKITNYTITWVDDLSNLEEVIKDYLKDGWQPYGNITFVPRINQYDSTSSYCQVLVKYGK